MDVVKILNKLGFSIIRQSGSHMILIKEDSQGKRTVVVPKHKELAKGTLLSIISQSGLSKEEFLNKLK
jgi:predicted RNA binding protein YcfA (HicA-like mRNA interferase family)